MVCRRWPLKRLVTSGAVWRGVVRSLGAAAREHAQLGLEQLDDGGVHVVLGCVQGSETIVADDADSLARIFTSNFFQRSFHTQC